MPVDPQVSALLAALPPPVDPTSLTIAEHRAAYAALVQLRRGPGVSLAPVASAVDLQVEGIGCRLYRPAGEGPQHVLVYLHGGGWAVGDLESHDAVVRSLCHQSGLAVLAVDYRLAPEHPFPAALEDSLAVTRWASEQDFAGTSVGGDSAGANLAAAVALVFRAEGRELAAQLLVYPALDAGASCPSYALSGYGLEGPQMAWFWELYAGGHPLDDPLLSPSATADLRGLAPAVVATAEYDVLRDEGDRYAARLAEAGVAVWSRQYAGLIHGFLGQAGTVVAAGAAAEEIACALRDLVGVQR